MRNQNKKLICFYSPYIPKHFGGGEKYLLDCARIAVELGHTVYLAISGNQISPEIKQKYQEFLGVSLDNIEIIASPLGTNVSLFKKMSWTGQFDCIYYLTDGSLFFSAANRNILHIQIPFTDAKNSFVERLKLGNWQVKNSNSEFTQSIVEQAWNIKIPFVHHPMVEPAQSFSNETLALKQPIILSVGRFFRHLHSKRQDVMVEIFRKLSQDDVATDWKLVLIGSIEDQAFAEEVANQAQGLSIELLHDVSHQELWNWYQRAAVYWHAAGFEIDQTQHPEKVEHFGISTVEAMSQGCVPVVINKGGQPEILGDELAPLLWESPEECIQKTKILLGSPQERNQFARAAAQRATFFGKERFKDTLRTMIG